MNKNKLEDIKRKLKYRAPEIAFGVCTIGAVVLTIYGLKVQKTIPSKAEFAEASRTLDKLKEQLQQCFDTPTVHLTEEDRQRLKSGAAIVFEFGQDAFCLMHCTDEHS